MTSVILLFITCLSRFIRNPLDSNTFCTQVIQQKGQQLYHSGEYQKAYRLFVGLQELQRQQWTESGHWQQQRHQQLSVYYQIKCLLHLGKPQEALNICYTMVKLRPSSTWYQLAADIYIQDGRLDLALNAVSSSSRLLCGDGQWDEMNFQEQILYEGYLHQQHQQKQQMQQHTPARLNMVDILSYDIVCSIFMLLPLKSLVVCIRVSRTWRSLILTNPLFWQHLDFHGSHRRPLSTATIQLYLSRLDGVSLRSLLVHNEQDAQALLKCLCQSNCNELSTLDWTSFQCNPTECWPLFRQVILSAGKSLTKLRLGSGWFKMSDLMHLVSTTSCPCLTTLDVYDCFTGHSPYNNHDVNGPFAAANDMNYGTTLPPMSLRYLGLSGVHGLTALYLSTLLQRCPHLIELTLHNCLVNINPILHLLHHSCPRLQRFSCHQNRSNQLPTTISEPRLAPIMPSSTAPQEHTSTQLRHDDRTTHGNHLHRLLIPITTTNKPCLDDDDDDDSTGHAYWKHFIMKQTRTLTDDLLHTVLGGSYHTIQTLDLQGNPRLTDDSLFNMMNQQPPQPSDDLNNTRCALPRLEECSFANCLSITKVGLCSLMENAPRLRHVDLSGLSGVTDAVLLSMALSCPYLSILRLAHCRSMTDRGMRCFIDTFGGRKSPLQQLSDDDHECRWLQELDLTDTNLSMECLAYVMCHIRRDGI